MSTHIRQGIPARDSFQSISERYEQEEAPGYKDVPQGRDSTGRFLPKTKAVKHTIEVNGYTSDKKDGSSFHWRDASKILQDVQHLNTKASWTQDTAHFDFSHRTRPLMVLPIADWHFGSLGSDYRLIEQFTDTILNTPDLYIGIVGDMLQMSIKMRGILEISDNAISPKLQMRFLESWMSDIESKVLWSTWDNHCFLPGTEALTQRGWIDFQFLEDKDKIAQFDRAGNITFASPQKIWKDDYSGDMYDFEVYNHRQVVTANHHVVRKGLLWKTPADQIDALCSNELFLEGMSEDQIGVDYEDDLIRLIMWTCMDGTVLLNHKMKKNYRVQFKLSRPEKIEALCSLLDRMGVPYTYKPATLSSSNKMQPYYIRIYSTWAKKIAALTGLGPEKKIPFDFSRVNLRQLEIILETLEITDATTCSNSIEWTTISKPNVDIIQQACVLNGYRSHYRPLLNAVGGFPSHALSYYVSIKRKNIDRPTPATIKTFSYEGKVYCVTMPLGTIVTRYEGKVAFTGNSQIREEDATGFSNYANIFSRKVTHFNGIGHMEIEVGGETYRIATSHKFRGGRTETNCLNGLSKYLRLTAPYMEMAIGGDTHVCGYAQYPEGGEIKTVLNTGTLQTNSGYAKRYCTLTTLPEFPCFLLRHDRHRIVPFPSLEDMLNY